jgi:predicted Zn-dependent peptidase
MRFRLKAVAALLCAVLLSGIAFTQDKPAAPAKPAKAAEKPAAKSTTTAPANTFSVPVEYYKLPNGLRVALSQDHSAPTVTVAVYYRIGFRVEPKDRTGFAHLFEHMMFQGSENLGKMEFIKLVQQNGGILNGSTRFDFTNYFEVLPANKLETALWAEADRMKGLAITQDNLTNQQGVVGNEVKVNVLNRPYGGFPWLQMPQYANTNWYNAHNFYGDLKDIEAANLEDVKKFFSTYYAPNNAALAIVGDFEPAKAKAFVQKYFAAIPQSKVPPQPDLTEPRQTEERKASYVDNLAKKPAIALAYHMPDRNTPEYYAMILLDEVLLQGDDSLLRQQLVKNKAYTGSVNGGINMLGNAFDYNGPMLWTMSLIHDANVSDDQIVSAVDEVIDNVRKNGVDQKAVDRAIIKGRSDMYDNLTQFGGFGRADLLASFSLFDDNPGRINSLEQQIRKVTPELIKKTADEYLRPTNRTVLSVQVKPAEASASGAGK